MGLIIDGLLTNIILSIYSINLGILIKTYTSKWIKKLRLVRKDSYKNKMFFVVKYLVEMIKTWHMGL